MGIPGKRRRANGWVQRNHTDISGREKGNRQLWPYCFLTAAVLLALASQCSFLYPLNDWVDANIFFTMGKSMMNGKVLYRDVYDHKGPLLYFLHGVAWLFSHKSFLGIYVLEIVSWTVFLAGAYRTMALYVKNPGLWQLPVFCALIVTSPSFCHGDSAEELVLPLLMWGLYFILKYLKQSDLEPMRYRMVFFHGLLAGCILCVKFTLLGLYLAWTLVAMAACFWQKEWRRGAAVGLVMLAGMAAACIPWIVYFGWHRALGDWWTGYIYNNLFLYSANGAGSLPATLKAIVKMTLDTFVSNWQFSILTVVGVLWYGLLDQRESLRSKAGLWFVCVITTLGICVGVKQWQPYYGLVLCVFSCLGAAALTEGARQCLGRIKRTEKVWMFCSFILGVGICLLGANDRERLLAPRDSLVQYQFAQQMQVEEDTTLLDYGYLDSGFYTVTGIVPDCRYFARLNLALEEMLITQTEYVADARGDYIVTRGEELAADYQDEYDLIGHGQQEYEGILYQYYLYEKVKHDE